MKTSPIFSVRHKSGELYWLDLEWGQSWSAGCGYLPCVSWGEERKYTGYCRDNIILVDCDDCEVDMLGWTQVQEYEYEVPRLYISA